MGSLVCSTWALLLRSTSSVVVAHGLSCPVACGILVPRPGIEHMSPALEGRFFTTGPPGKSQLFYFFAFLFSFWETFSLLSFNSLICFPAVSILLLFISIVCSILVIFIPNILLVLLKLFFLFQLFFKNLFIYFWLHWVFVAVRGLSLVVASGGYSSLRCAGFSLQWLLLLRSMGSRHVGFSSCGTQAQ